MRLAAKNAGAGRFESRLRALERLSGGEGGRGAAALDGQRSRAGGVVAVLVRVLGVGEGGGHSRSLFWHRGRSSACIEAIRMPSAIGTAR